MSVQVKRRREAASFLSTYVGAQAELLVDTTNNRVQVHDGATPGGWPAAKLGEVVTNGRTAIADANYTALVSDRSIAVTALTAARTVTLPASTAYPTGTRLLVFDESGACSTTLTLTLAAAGTDLIDGAATATIITPYGFLACQSNGAGKWTILDRAINKAPTQTVLTTSSGTSGTGTYATPVGASWLRLRMIGAGGGGAASGTSPGAATAGGATSFGGYSCNGGGAGAGTASAANTGAPTSGDINLSGNGGVDGMTGVAGLVFAGGTGGASPFAGGGRSTANGNGGNGPPSSGAGGGGAGGSGAMAGGGGGASGAYLEKIISAPAASYAYTVGAKGAGGAAGTGGNKGGNGGDGLIIVEEHYD